MKRAAFFLSVLILVFVFSFPAFAVETMTVALGAVSSGADGKAEVPVSILDNPGVVTLNLKIVYDAEKLRLSGIRDQGILGDDFEHSVSENSLLWKNYTHEGDFTENGTAAILEFEVIGGTEGEKIPVSLEAPNARYNAMNMGTENVPLKLVSGGVTVGGFYQTPVWPFVAGGAAALAAAGAAAYFVIRRKKRVGSAK